jgi:hypothetical protein
MGVARRFLIMIAALGLVAAAPAPDAPSANAPAPDAQAYLDRALDILQAEHLNSAQADWPTLRTKAHQAIAGATTPDQTYAAIRSTIQALGERHTQLFAPRPPRPPGPAQPPVRALPQGRWVAQHVALLAMPSLLRDLTNPADDGRPYRDAAATFIASAQAEGACGWIIDLRPHSGGDMWPGLLGLTALIGPGPHGAFIDAKGRQPWPKLPGPPSLDSPVAVLIGPRTGSSGEMIAIAFEGRPATRFFGAPTAGLTTANRPHVLSDGAVLTVTTSRVEDRDGRRYDGPIQPDLRVDGDLAETSAVAWLGTQGCATTALASLTPIR